MAPTAHAPNVTGSNSCADVQAPFGRPTVSELVDVVREYLERGVMQKSEGGAKFEARIARNVLQTVQRQLDLGPAIAQAHGDWLAALGFDDDAALAAALRSGRLDGEADWAATGHALATAARDQLLVANPAYLPTAST